MRRRFYRPKYVTLLTYIQYEYKKAAEDKSKEKINELLGI